MKRFVFKEARLLALRKQQVTAAELTVIALRRQETLAKEAIVREEQAIHDLSRSVMESGPNNVTHMSQTAMVLRHRLEDCRSRLSLTEQELKAAFQSLVRTRVAAKSLAELEAARRREYKKYMNKHLQLEIDFQSSRQRMMRERTF